MLLGVNPYKFLDEAATADLMDPATSEEVKDTVDELQDTLTNNIEEVKPEDMVTNGGVPVTTAESAVLVESKTGEYFISMEAVIAMCEDAAEEELPAGEEATADQAAEQANNIIELVADKNGVDPDQITVVINAESCAYICECAINESKCSKGKGGKKKAVKKAKILSKVSKALEGKIKVFKKKK